MNNQKISVSGFTLIELLIVIAILGILAAGVVVVINPLQRINQANDSKVKNDIGQMATAEQAYFTTNQYYASAVRDLVTSRDLKVAPAAPTNYTSYVVTGVPAGCTTALKTCTDVGVSGQLKAPAVRSNTMWCFKSSTGLLAESTVCP